MNGRYLRELGDRGADARGSRRSPAATASRDAVAISAGEDPDAGGLLAAGGLHLRRAGRRPGGAREVARRRTALAALADARAALALLHRGRGPSSAIDAGAARRGRDPRLQAARRLPAGPRRAGRHHGLAGHLRDARGARPREALDRIDAALAAADGACDGLPDRRRRDPEASPQPSPVRGGRGGRSPAWRSTTATASTSRWRALRSAGARTCRSYARSGRPVRRDVAGRRASTSPAAARRCTATCSSDAGAGLAARTGVPYAGFSAGAAIAAAVRDRRRVADRRSAPSARPTPPRTSIRCSRARGSG